MFVCKQPWHRSVRGFEPALVALALAAVVSATGCGVSAPRKNHLHGVSRLSAPRKPAHPAQVLKWDPSGVAMPPAAVPGWHRVFADNFAHDNVPVGGFSGCSWPPGTNINDLRCSALDPYPTVSAKWFAYPTGWAGVPSSGTYFPSAVVSIRHGIMNLHLHTAVVDGRTTHMLAAMVPKVSGGTGPVGGMLYGRYVIRARFDPLYGYRASFLLWPDSNDWLRDGAISFPDAPFDAPYVNGFMHHRGASSGSQQDAYGTPTQLSQWHTYEIDWTSTSVAFYLDGGLVGASFDRSLIPDTPMHLVLQTNLSTAVPAPPDQVSGNAQIDWVAVYARTSGTRRSR